MLNLKNIKILICTLFIFLIIALPIGNIFAADPISNLPTTFFLGPNAVPAAFLLSGLQTLNILPEAKTGGNVLNPVEYVYSGIILAVNSLLGIATTTLLQVGQGLLNFAIDGNFTGKSVTDFDSASPSYNFVVAEGWGIVRNVANAALVIGLVIIAINIILGREENKAKKILINFIIIALLINFTPIICGFIIDGSNILTKSFMSGGIDSSFANAINKSYSDSYTALKPDPLKALLAGLILLIFSLIVFFVYILYALLFLGRYVILWLLVIVSPIAFATKVFPQSKYIKKVFPSILYWDDWWESFIQWCVIGIPAGMSIYLSNLMMSKIVYKAAVVTTGTSSDSIVSAIIGGLFDYSIPLIVLIAGFFISISAGGQIGSAVGGIATNVWGRTGGRITERGKEVVGAVGERAGAAGTWAKEGITGRIGGTVSNVFGNEKIDTSTKEGREEGRYKFREYMGKPRELAAKYSLVAPGTVGKKSKEETEAAEFAKGIGFSNYEQLREKYSQPQRTAIEKKLAEEDLSKFLEGAKAPAELERRLKSVAATGNDKTKNAAFLHTINNTNAGSTDWGKVFKTNISKSISSMSAKDAVEKLTPNSLGNVDVFEKLTHKQLNAIVERGSREQTNALKNLLTGSGAKDLTERKDALENIKNLPGPVDQIQEAEDKLDDLNKKISDLIKVI